MLLSRGDSSKHGAGRPKRRTDLDAGVQTATWWQSVRVVPAMNATRGPSAARSAMGARSARARAPVTRSVGATGRAGGSTGASRVQPTRWFEPALVRRRSQDEAAPVRRPAQRPRFQAGQAYSRQPAPVDADDGNVAGAYEGEPPAVRRPRERPVATPRGAVA